MSPTCAFADVSPELTIKIDTAALGYEKKRLINICLNPRTVLRSYKVIKLFSQDYIN